MSSNLSAFLLLLNSVVGLWHEHPGVAEALWVLVCSSLIFTIFGSVISLPYSFGKPVTIGFLRRSCSKSLTEKPCLRKFNLTRSDDSPLLSLIWIRPEPLQTPRKLSSSTVAPMTCLLPLILFKFSALQFSGRFPTTRSITCGSASRL